MKDGMAFDAGTWWLIGTLLTGLLGIVGALVSRSIFKELDKHAGDIKEVRENYTTREQHDNDVKDLRKEMKDIRLEMRSEIQQLSEDISEIKENCLRKEDFIRVTTSLEHKLDRLNDYLIGGSKNG
jgi:uncharacterized protein Yka (UPF0111/DUF47 family)